MLEAISADLFCDIEWNKTKYSNLEYLSEKLILCLNDSTVLIGPKNRKNISLKPYWNDTLNSLKKNKQQQYNQWKSNGKSRNSHSHYLYKEARKLFRRELRLSKYKFETEIERQIENNYDIDAKQYWYLLNCKCKRKSQIEALNNAD